MTSLWNDLRYAVRQLRKSPGFTIAAVLTLALGIGANSAMFTMVDRVLLEPLRFHQPARIVQINTQSSARRLSPRVTDGDVPDLRNLRSAFQDFSTFDGGEMGVQLGNRAVYTNGYEVNPEFFSVLGIQPASGRFFNAQDAGYSAVVSYSFAQRNFGSPAGAVGKILHYGQKPYQIVGVTPRGLAFPRGAGFWAAVPTTMSSLNRTSFNYYAIARLKPGVSLAAAQLQASGLAHRLANAYPISNKGRNFLLQPLRDQLVAPVRQTLWFLMGAVAFVLLIACLNVANLFLARTSQKSREIAARIALGASRTRIVRQLLIESFVVAVVGGGAGILLGNAILRTFVALVPPDFPRLHEISLDLPVLGFTLVLALITAVVFGLWPAVHASRTSPDAILRSNVQRTSGSRAAIRFRESLIAVEVACSLVLMVGAGLMLRSLLTLNAVDPGFRTQKVLVMDADAPVQTTQNVQPGSQQMQDALRASQQMEEIRQRIAAVPGVQSVAAANGLPMGDMGSNGAYIVKGRQTWDQGGNFPSADFILTSPDYFSTLAIPLIQGREFREQDTDDAPAVAIISESLARQSFPGENPIGRQIQCGLDAPIRWMTVIGVVKDVRQDSLSSRPGPALYMPLLQHPTHATEVQFAVLTHSGSDTLQTVFRREVASVNPLIALRFHTFDMIVANTASASRFRTALLDGFALLALLLAILGVYSVTSYTVAQRVPEVGIRMTLGATRRGILTMFLRRAFSLAVIGICAGLILSAGLSHWIASMLYGITAFDIATYALALLATLLTVLLAAWIPAYRAASIDPMQALRSE